MQVSPEFLLEIYLNLEHGAIQAIANQLKLSRNLVQRELTNIGKKKPYDERIINAAIARLEVAGIVLKHKPATL